MKQYSDICGECGRVIPELEPATRMMQQYPRRGQSQKLVLVASTANHFLTAPSLPARAVTAPCGCSLVLQGHTAVIAASSGHCME